MTLGAEIRWLSEADVAASLTMPEVINAVEGAFRLYGEGRVQMPPKIYLEFDPFGGDLRAMPAYVKGDAPAAGVKIVNSSPQNPEKGLPAVSGVMVLNDPRTGLPLAIMAAGTLTSLRTGAAGGIAAKYLARKHSARLGLVGCGRQAITQTQALQELFALDEIRVWSPFPNEIQAFCEKQKTNFSAALIPAKTAEEACDADIVVTTTPARQPVVKAAWIKPGTHINAIGADAPGKQELETALLSKCKVVVDEWGQASHGGEINVAVTAGTFTQTNLAAQLGDVVAGRVRVRTADADITLFDSTGLALQDVAVAQLVFQKAQKNNKGKVLNFNG
jgi:alanine dehydrogenase